MIRVAIHTLGCRTNQAESASIRSALARGDAPIAFVDWREPADVYLLNSCTVTARADRQSRQWLHRAARTAPGARLVVFGCYAQAEARRIAELPGVAAVIGNAERSRVVDAVLAAAGEGGSAAEIHTRPPTASDPVTQVRVDADPAHVRAALKIQEGCDRACAYCIVPRVRGPSRSVPMADVVDGARRLADAGHPEVVLTGTHVGRWGAERTDGPALSELLDTLLAATPPTVRFRVSSLDPDEVDPPLLERLAGHPRLCPHLHLSLQHTDDDVLRAMRRPPTSARTGALIARAATARPRPISVGADVLVGFPAEDERAFEQLLARLGSTPLAYLHVFGFSPRAGTEAASLAGGLAREGIARRVARVRVLADERLRPRFLAGLPGRQVEVVVERADDGGRLRGTTAEFVPVTMAGPARWIGTAVPARIDAVEPEPCVASALDAAAVTPGDPAHPVLPCAR